MKTVDLKALLLPIAQMRQVLLEEAVKEARDEILDLDDWEVLDEFEHRRLGDDKFTLQKTDGRDAPGA
jgi:hypothetical protein